MTTFLKNKVSENNSKYKCPPLQTVRLQLALRKAFFENCPYVDMLSEEGLLICYDLDKLARVGNGYYLTKEDSWQDKSGYGEIALQELNERNNEKLHELKCRDVIDNLAK